MLHYTFTAMKRTTIKDIGKMAGVNPSTVSRALNDSPDISVVLKNKIKAIAKELNYQPNLLATNLRKQKSFIIGLIIPHFSIYFIPSVLEGITRVLNKYGYKLLLLSSENDVSKEKENIQFCCRNSVDGILMSISESTVDAHHMQSATDQKIPILFFDNKIEDSSYHQVIMQDFKIGEEACLFLKNKNCKNILGVYGVANQPINIQRRLGFESQLSADITYHKIFATNETDIKEKVLAFLLNNPNIDGLFAINDELMMGTYMAILKQKVVQMDAITKIIVSDGKLPDLINTDIYYIQHDGLKLGGIITEKLVAVINNKSLATSIDVLEHETIIKNKRY
jgi:LacI family transcriptional regulator